MKKILILISVLLVILSACQEEEKFSIFCIGDSTMADKKPEVYPETGWCQVLGDYFNDLVAIKNHAVNGRSSKSFIDEGRWQIVLDSLKHGDYVFIQFGHNDQKEYDSTRYTPPFGAYSENLEQFVIETREKGATPVLLTSIVRRIFNEKGELEDTHGEYPVATRQVAKKQNVSLIDLQRITEKWVTDLGDEASKAMYLWVKPTEIFEKERKDNTHLCLEGANAIAQMAMENAKKQDLKFTKNLK